MSEVVSLERIRYSYIGNFLEYLRRDYTQFTELLRSLFEKCQLPRMYRRCVRIAEEKRKPRELCDNLVRTIVHSPLEVLDTWLLSDAYYRALDAGFSEVEANCISELTNVLTLAEHVRAELSAGLVEDAIDTLDAMIRRLRTDVKEACRFRDEEVLRLEVPLRRALERRTPRDITFLTDEFEKELLKLLKELDVQMR